MSCLCYHRMPTKTLAASSLSLGAPAHRTTGTHASEVVNVAHRLRLTGTPVSLNQDRTQLRTGKLGREVQQTSALNNKARPKQMQFAPSTLSTVGTKAENKPIGWMATKPETMQQGESYLFPAARVTPKICTGRNVEATVIYRNHSNSHQTQPI